MVGSEEVGPVWYPDLNQVPEPVQMGVATHGLRHQREAWQLDGLWSLHVYRYHADLDILGEAYRITPGLVSIIPPNVMYEHAFAGESIHAYAHFRLPMAEPRQQGLRALTPLGDEAKAFDRQLQQAISAFPGKSQRSSARLWDLLWQLAEFKPSVATQDGHPAWLEAERFIALNLSGSIAVADLAKQVGCSHNHLTRLCQKRHGLSVVAYIREQRLQHALHLLKNSTMPVETIARRVGIGDLQYFNKCVRRRFGLAPRALRGRNGFHSTQAVKDRLVE